MTNITDFNNIYRIGHWSKKESRFVTWRELSPKQLGSNFAVALNALETLAGMRPFEGNEIVVMSHSSSHYDLFAETGGLCFEFPATNYRIGEKSLICCNDISVEGGMIPSITFRPTWPKERFSITAYLMDVPDMVKAYNTISRELPWER